MKQNVQCPVCETYIFEWENDFDICPVCGWENDRVQGDDFDYWGGANDLTVNESKLFFLLSRDDDKKEKLLELEAEHKNITAKIYRKHNGADYRVEGDNAHNEVYNEHLRYIGEINKLANT